MKYAIQGAHVTKVYEVEAFCVGHGGFSRKPNFVSRTETVWENILAFECEVLPDYLSNWNSQFYISENEEVTIDQTIFRADECTVYLRSNKILSEKEDKETNAQKYQTALQEYYDYVIKEYPAVKEYLDVHEVKDVLENIDKIKEMCFPKETGKNDFWASTLFANNLKKEVCFSPVMSRYF